VSRLINMADKARLPGRGPWHIVLVALLVLVYFGLLLGSLSTTSVTTDEFGHLPLSYAYVKTGDAGWLLMNPPSQRVLAAFPLLLRNDVHMEGPEPAGIADFWGAGRYFMEKNRSIYHSLYASSRLAVAVLACLTGLVAYGFARSLAGPGAGLFALFLFAFSPDFLAHGGLVTCDLSAALAALAAFSSLYFYTRRRTVPRLLLVCVSVSLLPLSKFTALAFIFILPFMLFGGPGDSGAGKRGILSIGGPCRFAFEIFLIAAFSWVALMAAYGFQEIFTPLDKISLNSLLLSGMKKAAPWLPAPLPESFISAVDLQLIDGSRPWQNYFFGRVLARGSSWSYLACMLFKWPLPLLMLLLASLLAPRREALVRAFLPGAFFLVFISTVPDKQYGARFMLPSLGLFLVFTAASVAGIDSRLKAFPRLKALARIILFMLLLWYAGGTVAAFPHYIGYFNELAGGPRLPHHGHRYLADSNLDWGQDWMRLAKWQKEKGIERIELAYFGMVDPGIYGVNYSRAGCRPERGFLAVSVNLVLGVDAFRNMGPCYSFLGKMEPVARIGSSVRVYWID